MQTWAQRLRLARLLAYMPVAIIGAAVLVATACGGDDDAPTPIPPAATATATTVAAPTAIPTTPAGVEAFMLMAKESNPKRGGTFKMGVGSTPSIFDVYQSGTGGTLLPLAPRFDNLVRYHPLDPDRPIIPDLAVSWELTADQRSVVFKLREGVRFQDGTPFTAEDVKTTFDRVINPPEGFTSPRSPLYNDIWKLDLVDVLNPLTVRFNFPRACQDQSGAERAGHRLAYHPVQEVAGGEQLRSKQCPGLRRNRTLQDGVLERREQLVFEANDDYWNPELPYVDRFEILDFPSSQARESALRSGQIDFMRGLQNPVSLVELGARSDMTTVRSTLGGFRNDMDVNTQKVPKKVRQAIHLAIDRGALAAVLKEAHVFRPHYAIGIYDIPGTPGFDLQRQLQKPGYRADKTADLERAKQLMVEAGFPNGMKLTYLIRGAGATWDPAVQEMLRTALNIELELKPSTSSVYFEELAKLDWDLACCGKSSPGADPAISLLSYFGPDAPLNRSGWTHPDFTRLVQNVIAEEDPSALANAVLEVEALLEDELPVIPFLASVMGEAWYNYVKGYEGELRAPISMWHDNVRWDTVWIDK